ncbi:MAG: carbohydrate ABC transporter permease [Spirochaetia bacterium]
MTSIRHENRQALLFILPALIATMFVHIIPIFWGIYISFTELDIQTLTQWTRAPFIGIENYVEIFTSGLDIGRRYLRSIWNITVYGLITIPVGYCIAFGVAMLMNQKFKGRTIVRGIVLLPYITPDPVAYNVWRFIFQARVGLVNKALMDFGIIGAPLIWLVGDRALSAVIVASIWKNWPFTALVLLSGLQGIPKELYDAAKMDGANPLQAFRHITFPMLWPVSKTMLIVALIWNFHAFNQFYVMLGGDTSSRAAVPALVILREAFHNLHYGLGAAMAVILLIVIFLLTFFAIRTQREDN